MISGIVSEASGSWSGRPSPSRSVSSKYARVISAASSLRGLPGLARRLVDLVVDVGDVDDQLDLVALVLEEALQEHEDDVRPRVADVDARVRRRAARVDPDRPGSRGSSGRSSPLSVSRIRTSRTPPMLFQRWREQPSREPRSAALLPGHGALELALVHLRAALDVRAAWPRCRADRGSGLRRRSRSAGRHGDRRRCRGSSCASAAATLPSGRAPSAPCAPRSLARASASAPGSARSSSRARTDEHASCPS